MALLRWMLPAPREAEISATAESLSDRVLQDDQSGRQSSPGSSADTARPLAWSADDSRRVATLRRDGRSVTGRHAIVWAPRDSISEDSLRVVLAGIETGL